MEICHILPLHDILHRYYTHCIGVGPVQKIKVIKTHFISRMNDNTHKIARKTNKNKTKTDNAQYYLTFVL